VFLTPCAKGDWAMGYCGSLALASTSCRASVLPVPLLDFASATGSFVRTVIRRGTSASRVGH